jgi:UDP-GlcNAc:undecaprenyl-phosphate GlcNAc-1-phosphate transferase
LSLIYSLFQKFYLSTVYIATIDRLINFGFFFTILCILLLQISINLSDGSNAVVGLYSVFWSIVLIYLNRSFFLNIVLLLFILNLIIFLLFNFRTKIFLGTAGCNYITAFFSVISIYLNGNQLIPSEYFVSLFFIPGIDMIRIFLLRLYRKKNIFTFDRNHLHHILIKRFGKFDSLIYLLICMIFFFFSTLFQQKNYLLFLIIFSSIYIVGLNKLCKKK